MTTEYLLSQLLSSPEPALLNNAAVALLKVLRNVNNWHEYLCPADVEYVYAIELALLKRDIASHIDEFSIEE